MFANRFLLLRGLLDEDAGGLVFVRLLCLVGNEPWREEDTDINMHIHKGNQADWAKDGRSFAF